MSAKIQWGCVPLHGTQHAWEYSPRPKRALYVPLCGKVDSRTYLPPESDATRCERCSYRLSRIEDQ